MTKKNQKLNNSWQTKLSLLKGLKNKIILRAAFSVVILLLTAVLLFSMTAAWYTNVADTGGLIFVAKQWDFNGQITVGGDVISMAPGDGGIVSMYIANYGETVATASVTVSKADLNELMKQRLYFYVDTSFYRNSERMDKVYITSTNAYTYTVFPDSQILISQDSQNAPALKWRWVYDVLGYYVYGSITDTTYQIDEYIRPIEYSYDPITTTFAANGYPETIDGTQTVEDFLLQLSSNDGYPGTIDVSKRTATGFYPVYVNSSGYGVWAYLCSRSEILGNMEDDTKIGTSINTDTYSVEISVTGTNSTDTAISVGDKESLEAILASTGYVNLKLTNNIALDNELVIKNGHQVDIDLNGCILSSTAERVISAEEGSHVALSNGYVVGSGNDIAIETTGAELTLNNVVLMNTEEGIKISDHLNDVAADSRVHIVDSQIVGNSDGLWIYANNGDTETKTTVIIERSTIIGNEYAGIVCNGSYKNTDIQITDSSISGYYTAIYHPQPESTMTIDRSTLTGITGLVVKGGMVTINDSVIKGTGTPEQITEPGYAMSGFCDTGDGIYLEANYEWGATITVTGDSTVVTSDNALAVRKYMPDESRSNIYIYAGTYSSGIEDNEGVANYLAPGVSQSEVDGKYVVQASE